MTQWIAIDWGTTHCRAYAMNKNNEVIDERSSHRGMGSLDPAEFEPALLELIEDWLTQTEKMRIIASGMVGARQGWQEVSYSSVPHKMDYLPVEAVRELNDPRLDVYIVGGICQEQPADVMRGEETQIAGLLNTTGLDNGIIGLPGTHAKWVTVKNRVLESFQTFMTGELHAILSSHSILRLDTQSDDWSDKTFLHAIETAYKNPEKLSAHLFTIRATKLVRNDTSSTSAQLSGLLLGTELNATQKLWQGQTVNFIGDTELVNHYSTALEHLGGKARRHSARDCTLSGLSTVNTRLNKN